MATALTLFNEIRRRLQDYTDETYGAALLLEALNGGSAIFASTTGCCQAIHNFSSGTSISSKALSDLTYRYLNVYAVEYAGSALYWAPRSEAAKWSLATGTPTGWSVWADTLYLDTIVTLSSNNDIDVHYTYIPNDLTNEDGSDTVGIPEKWHPALVAYGKYYILDMLRETGLADRAWSEFSLIQQAAAKINEALLGGGGYS